ncbi:MAG: hypothetical protein UU47_C0026G0012, partial [candidate division TM6 bacterium GW2011_GWE2_41_16]
IEKACEQYPSLQAICGDAGYRKQQKIMLKIFEK